MQTVLRQNAGNGFLQVRKQKTYIIMISINHEIWLDALLKVSECKFKERMQAVVFRLTSFVSKKFFRVVALPALLILVSGAVNAVDLSRVGIHSGTTLSAASGQVQQTSNRIALIGSASTSGSVRMRHDLQSTPTRNEAFAEVTKVAYQENVRDGRSAPMQFRAPMTAGIVAQDLKNTSSQTFGSNHSLIEAETWGMLLVGLGVMGLRARSIKDRAKRVYF